LEQLSHHERSNALAQMAAEGVDVLIIGGGITGVSVAMDAAARGYRVGLVERHDFASGTSSKSTKLVHGGIRYLPQFDFVLVREALVERGLLFRNAPWIVRPLAFILPLYANAKKPLGVPFTLPGRFLLDWEVQAGLLMYDLFSGRLGIKHHQRISVAAALQRAPSLKREGLKHAFVYYDGQTDDTRLTTTVLRTAVRLGSLAANYAEVTSFQIDGGQIAAAHVCDNISGKQYTIRARHVVNAGGVFAEKIESLTGIHSDLSVKPAKGVHLVFSRDKLPITDEAVVLPETDDGRLLFIVPWEGRVVVGTTDTEGGDVERPETNAADIAYLLDHLHRYLNVNLTEHDIISTYAGYRPLVSSKDPAKSSAHLSRSHAVLDGPGGMVTIVGGKLTTWRRMAEDTVNHVARRDGNPPSQLTRQLYLEGTVGWPRVEREVQRRGTKLGLDLDILEHLGQSFGANLESVLQIAAADHRLARRIVPDLPYILAEVVQACRYEMAMTVDDVLSRRTRLVLEDQQQGVGVAREIAQLMAHELGWDQAESERQVRAYYKIVGRNYSEGDGADGSTTPQQQAALRQSGAREEDDWSNATIEIGDASGK